MKKFTLLLVCIVNLSFTEIYASHIMGGDIRIEFIGDSTNTPKHYMVHVNLYRRYTGGASLPSTISTMVDAPCFSNTTISLNRFLPAGVTPAGDGGFFPNLSECSSITPGNLFQVSVHSYKKDIVLTGNCQYKFSTEILGRTFSSNLNPYSGNFYIEALLNIVPWTNSTPKFEEYPRFYHCLNQSVQANFSVIDEEGDSIYYTRSVPQGTFGSTYSYQTGYSKNQFLPTAGGVVFDSITGQMTFQPSALGRFVAKIKVREYRFDTINNVWNFMSTISNDLTYYIESSCDTSVKTGHLVKDSTGFDTTAVYYCSDSTIDLTTQSLYMVSSLAADGSDFSITGLSGKSYQLVGARAINQFNSQYASGIRLHLLDSLTQSDTLIVKMRLGTDSNSILNHCGYEFNTMDSVLVAALDTCTKILPPSALAESQLERLISIYPNPTVDKLSIELSPLLRGNVTKLLLTNIFGRKIFEIDSSELNNPISEISTFGLPKGIYLLVIEATGYQLYVKKIIIK